ncbi:MAG: BCCT family transporter [Alcanivoracaceae bacterium]|nr:BCCT family transporter [Alcanivoracaceae bacterium]
MLAERGLPRSTILVPVFAPAVIVSFLLVAGTLANPTLAGELFADALHFITHTFGWFYMLAVAIFLVFIVGIAISRFGNIRLGPDHSSPEYPFPVWFAMLFSAGYGIALLFFGVAEPVLHYADPPTGAAQTVDAAKQAMQIAFFHWGFHIWAIYGLVGLVLSYFAFRHGLPLSMRSALYPLIGEKIYGPLGHTVDVFAILGTLFGIATTLGLSVTQINAGLNYLWPSIPVSTTVQVVCIFIITGLAIFSVVAGMDKGVKRLSILNMVLAITLMTFVFLAGPSILILETFLENTGSYLNHIVERTFNLQAYSRGDWIGNWTLFIFGWTIAWAPFVGLFIARISRGRTIREFVLGVMLVPSMFTFLWFSIFGDTALNMIMNEGYTALIGDVQSNTAIALFKLYERLPLTEVVSFVTVILIITFFVTSSDSGSLVIDSLSSGGSTDTPVWQRVFWASTEGIVASVLLIAGGLSALQTMTIASALPFAVIMLLSAWGLWRALVIEGYREDSMQQRQSEPTVPDPLSWKERLNRMLNFPDQDQASDFVEETGYPAMRELAATLNQLQWHAEVQHQPGQRCRLHIVHGDGVNFFYELKLVSAPRPAFSLAALAGSEDHESQYWRVEVFLRRGSQAYDVYGYDQQELIGDMLHQFGNYLHFRHISPGNLPWEMAELNVTSAPGSEA